MERKGWLFNELIAEGRRKDELFKETMNYMLVFFSILFAVAISFFIQAFFIKYKASIEGHFLNNLLIISFLGCIIIGGFIYFLMREKQIGVERSHKRYLKLSNEFAYGSKK